MEEGKKKQKQQKKMRCFLLPLLFAGAVGETGFLVMLRDNCTAAGAEEVHRVCGTRSRTYKIGGFKTRHCEGVEEAEMEALSDRLDGTITVERDSLNKDVLHAMPGGCTNQASTDTPWGLSRLTQRHDWEWSGSTPAPFHHNTEWGDKVDTYVMDTGVECGIEELNGRCSNMKDYVASKDEIHRDDNGHGTYVASLVAGKTHGVARKANIISAKVVDHQGHTRNSYILDALADISVAVKQTKRPSLILMAFGVLESSVFDAALRAMVELGVAVVASGGNSYCRPMRPELISVGAHGRDGKVLRCEKSQDLYAPGEDIRGASAENLDGSVVNSGSSASAAYAAGAAASFLSKKPWATPLDVKMWLIESSLKMVLVSAFPNRALFIPCDESQSTAPGGGSLLVDSHCTQEPLPHRGAMAYKATRGNQGCWVVQCPHGEDLILNVTKIQPSDLSNVVFIQAMDRGDPLLFVMEAQRSVVAMNSARLMMGSFGHGNGGDFEIEWECRAREPTCTAVEGGGVVTYPVDNGRYPASSVECWTLTCDTPHIEIEWHYVDITSESNTLLSHDILTVEDTADSFGTTHLMLQGHPAVGFYGNSVKVRFASYHSPLGSGFRFTWRCTSQTRAVPEPFEPPVFVKAPAVVASKTAVVVRNTTSAATEYLLECEAGMLTSLTHAEWRMAHGEVVRIRNETGEVLVVRYGDSTFMGIISTQGRLTVELFYGTQPLSTFRLELSCLPAAERCPALPLGSSEAADNCFTIGGPACPVGESRFSVSKLAGSVTMIDEVTGEVTRVTAPASTRSFSNRVQVVVHGTGFVTWGCGRWGTCTEVDHKDRDSFSISDTAGQDVDCWLFKCPDPSQNLVFKDIKTRSCSYPTTLLDNDDKVLASITCPRGLVVTDSNVAVLTRTGAALIASWSCGCENLLEAAAPLSYPRNIDKGDECWTLRCDTTKDYMFLTPGMVSGDSVVVRDSTPYKTTLRSNRTILSREGDLAFFASIGDTSLYDAGEAFSLDYKCAPENATDAPPSPPVGCKYLAEPMDVFWTNSSDYTCWYMLVTPPKAVYFNATYDLAPDTSIVFNVGTEHYINGGSGYEYVFMEATKRTLTIGINGSGVARIGYVKSCDTNVVPGLIVHPKDNGVSCWRLTCPDDDVPLAIAHESGAPLAIEGGGVLNSQQPTHLTMGSATISLEPELPGGTEVAFSWTCDTSNKLKEKEHCYGEATKLSSDTGSVSWDRYQEPGKCWWLTCPQAVKVLTLTMDYEHGYDFVEVYPVHSDTPLDRFTGKGTVHVGYHGDIVVKSLLDKNIDSTLTMKWECGQTAPRKNVQLTGPANPIQWDKTSRNCFHEFAPFERTTTLRYPSNGGSYPPMTSKCWRMECATEGTSRVNLNTNLEPGYDKIEAYDKEGRWLGETTADGDAEFSSTGDIYLHFTSDIGTEGTGFTAELFCNIQPPTHAPGTPAPPQINLRRVKATLRVISNDLQKAVEGSTALMPALELATGGSASCVKVCHEMSDSTKCVECMAVPSGRFARTAQQGDKVALEAELEVVASMDNEGVKARLSTISDVIANHLGGPLVEIVVDSGSSDSDSDLSTGAIIGIVLGSLAFVVIAAVVVYFCCIRAKRVSFDDTELAQRQAAEPAATTVV
eukprot:TRINITY_DN4097_c0_g1_i1.p1 TRINITY_DN4097_c0_g1~~TRINITY_DN4097_c0_g1_i1.p1  ORF type:complete len:1635 (+),score=381.38 TRINITY_DN4097_c0_g1_i1:37-4941(+)